MPWLLLGIAAAFVYVVTRKPAGAQPAQPAQPGTPATPDVPGVHIPWFDDTVSTTGAGAIGTTEWFTIRPDLTGLPLPPSSTTRDLAVGEMATRMLGDGHFAKNGEVVTPANSRTTALLILQVESAPYTKAGIPGPAVDARVVAVSMPKGSPALAPKLPKLGDVYRGTRRDTLIAVG